MSQSDYGFASRLLHRIALGMPFITQTSFDIEKTLNKAPSVRDEPHVFVTGLARAGTTVLLRALHETGGYRSLTYRDMPFVLMPNTWKKYSSAFHKHEDEKERAHGDRIKVSFDSPEAFEEIFWRTFCGKDYIKDNHLRPHSIDEETLEQFIDFVALVVSSNESEGARYLSKNNNNILRLPAIRKAFPNAAILIPFRDPVQQANSLMKQHALFSARHKDDRFSYHYMQWLAHHEFGLTHKPFRFDQGKPLYEDPSDINYWLTMWRDTYMHVLATRPENSLLVCYETLCEQPAETMNNIFRTAGIDESQNAAANQFKAAPNATVDGIDQKLAAETRKLYEKMRLHSPN